jgi:hypothetical protein
MGPVRAFLLKAVAVDRSRGGASEAPAVVLQAGPHGPEPPAP